MLPVASLDVPPRLPSAKEGLQRKHRGVVSRLVLAAAPLALGGRGRQAGTSRDRGHHPRQGRGVHQVAVGGARVLPSHLQRARGRPQVVRPLRQAGGARPPGGMLPHPRDSDGQDAGGPTRPPHPGGGLPRRRCGREAWAEAACVPPLRLGRQGKRALLAAGGRRGDGQALVRRAARQGAEDEGRARLAAGRSHRGRVRPDVQEGGAASRPPLRERTWRPTRKGRGGIHPPARGRVGPRAEPRQGAKQVASPRA